MRVIANVDEADIGEVAVGQRASFGVNAWPTRVFEGVVTEVRNAPIVVQDVVTYGVVIEVPNDDLALRPGMTATAHVRTATARDVWRVPNAALHLTPPGSLRGDKPAVFALQGDRLARVDLELGITDGESTEVKGPIDPKLRIAVELTAAGKKAYGIVR